MTTAICRGNLFWPGPHGDGVCGAKEGELHAPGCDYERCGQCGGQYLYCACADALAEDTIGTDEDPRPLVPYIFWPNLCRRCGCKMPVFFDVPHDVWAHYIQIDHRDDIVCQPCFEEIATLIDGRVYERKHGGAVPLWSPEWRQRHNIAADAPPPFAPRTPT